MKGSGSSSGRVQLVACVCAAVAVLASHQDASTLCRSSDDVGNLQQLPHSERDSEGDTVSYVQNLVRPRLQGQAGVSHLKASSDVALSNRDESSIRRAWPFRFAMSALMRSGGPWFLQTMQDRKFFSQDLDTTRISTRSTRSLAPEKQDLEIPVWTREDGLDPWDLMDVIMLSVTLAILICADVFALNDLKPRFEFSMAVLAFMLTVSAIYMALVWGLRGAEDGKAWAAGYVMEWALSMDNLFVYHIVLKAFLVPREQAPFAIILGFYGALVLRVLFILGLSAALHFSPVFFVLVGILLIISGFMALRDDDELDVTNLQTVKMCKWCLGDRLLDKYDENGRCVLWDDKRTRFSLLFVVVLVIMVVDVFFAVDSVGSKTGQIQSTYINLSSSMLAMFTLRALFFIISSMAEYFELLKYGICTILVLLGVEMMFSSWFQMDLGVMCIVICLIFLLSVLASILLKGQSTANDAPDSSESAYEGAISDRSD